MPMASEGYSIDILFETMPRKAVDTEIAVIFLLATKRKAWMFHYCMFSYRRVYNPTLSP